MRTTCSKLCSLCWVTACNLGKECRSINYDTLWSRSKDAGSRSTWLPWKQPRWAATRFIPNTSYDLTFPFDRDSSNMFLPSRLTVSWGPPSFSQLRSPNTCSRLLLLISVKHYRKGSLRALICDKIWWINKLVSSEFGEQYPTLNGSFHCISCSLHFSYRNREGKRSFEIMREASSLK